MKKDKVGGDGSAANGWWIVNGGTKDLTDATLRRTTPTSSGRRELLQAKGIDPDSSGLFSARASSSAGSFVQSLMIAGELPGGLTRTNFILAQRAIDMTHPIFVEGIKFHMNGNKDAYFVEAGELPAVRRGQADAGSARAPIDRPVGKSKNCAWDHAVGNCK